MADRTWATITSSLALHAPGVARVWDLLLGGKDSFAVDRALFLRALAIDRDVAELARAVHDFRQRAIARLAGPDGIDQFIECGPGLPVPGEDTHDVAQRFNPEARVLYVDRDPQVMAHARALMATNELVRVVEADPLDVAALRGHAEVGEFVDWDRPIAIVNTVQLPFSGGQAHGPASFLGRVTPELVDGSYLVLSFFAAAPEGDLARVTTELGALFADGGLGGDCFLPVLQIAAVLDGLDLAAPGLIPCDLWPDDRDDEQSADSIRRCAFGAVAKVRRR